MKQLIIIFLFSYITISPGQGRNNSFDFSGMDHFWEVVKILESGVEPNENQWNDLLNTPGYKILTNGEFEKSFFMKNFRLVFNPKYEKELLDHLRNKKNLHHLTHYIKVRDNKRKIKDQQKKLIRNSFSKNAVIRTLEFLPQKKASQLPPVSFLIFENNGRGSSPIVIDLAATLEWDFMSFLSHEYHHWYRERNLSYNTSKIEFMDKDIIKTLSLIEAEGIADMVDKKDWFTKPSYAISKYARNFISDVGKTPYVIDQIDHYLSDCFKNSKKRNMNNMKISNFLPQRGHTTGYYMASLILKYLGKRELVKCVGNPFDFFLLYNKAVKESAHNYPGFSDQSIIFIKSLSKKYSE